MCKILSLDGGGSWAMLQLLTLKDKYPNMSGHQILSHYDLVIANSGGSIVLACLVENWTPDEALKLFREREKREMIFSKNTFRERFFPVDYLPGIGPKYSSVRKGRAFREIFHKYGDRPMNEIPQLIGHPSLKLIVCTYDALNNRAKFFRSYGNPVTSDFVLLTQAIHGSSNAPIQYFDFPARFKTQNTGIWFELWDGALGGFNNPVMAGIIEAVKCGYDKDDISVVSLGTSNKHMSMDDKKRFYQIKQCALRDRKYKLRFWRLRLQVEFFKKSIVNQAKTILYEPPDWSNYIAFMFLFNKAYHTKSYSLKRFIRLSPLIHTDENTPAAAVELLERLYPMDMNLTADEDIALVERCYEAWRQGLIPNQPIEYTITRGNVLVSTVGHTTWQDGFNDWP